MIREDRFPIPRRQGPAPGITFHPLLESWPISQPTSFSDRVLLLIYIFVSNSCFKSPSLSVSPPKSEGKWQPTGDPSGSFPPSAVVVLFLLVREKPDGHSIIFHSVSRLSSLTSCLGRRPVAKRRIKKEDCFQFMSEAAFT